MRNPAIRALVLFLLPGAALAQQFQYQPGLIPGTARWSEGVEAADVDRDGDMDLFFADGEGFSTAGVKRQNVLVINQMVPGGALSFTDESVARLGVHVANSKMVTTADVDGDGWVDALFVHAFNLDPPFLYVNRGAAQPGFFDEEGAARGLGAPLNSSGAQFGDLDDDGDLDLIVCHSGPSLLGGVGGKPRFYRNDGNGVFTEDAAALNAPTKIAHMDVQLVDVSGNWALDFVGINRGTNAGGNHYLLLNDGTGTFTNASSLLPSLSANSYEAEVGDLDGDEDLDLFFVSLSGFNEGVARNDLVPSGVLGFTALTSLGGSADDNEVALLDYDNDGDFDTFVGSLTARERLWRNDGGLVFTSADSAIQAVSDSTLDITVVDLDNDGAYELVTAQGESNMAQWANKIYRNTGAPDTLPPVVTDVLPVANLDAPLGPWIAKAKVRDQVLDDGKTWVRGEVSYVVSASPPTAAVSIGASAFSPPVLAVAAGTTVTWTNASGAVRSVRSTGAPYTFDSGPIAPGGSFERTFVREGTYAYESVEGGFTAQVDTAPGATTAAGLDSGGSIFRFTMTGDASAPGSELAYELYFIDQPGNVRAGEPLRVAAPPAPGVAFCFGDGSGTPCPCANPGASDRGCANSAQASGAALAALGSPSVSGASLVLAGAGLVPSQPGLYFQGNNRVAGGAGTVFGEGLRCAGGAVARLQVRTADGAGASATTIDVASKGGVVPGDTRRYQIWYRDPLGLCGGGFNLSNGLEVVWAP